MSAREGVPVQYGAALLMPYPNHQAAGCFNHCDEFRRAHWDLACQLPSIGPRSPFLFFRCGVEMEQFDLRPPSIPVPYPIRRAIMTEKSSAQFLIKMLAYNLCVVITSGIAESRSEAG